MIGVIYALPLLALLRIPRSRGRRRPQASARGVFRGLLGNRNFILLVLYFTLPAIAGWVVRDWMPDILKKKFDLGQGQAGVSAILYVQIASLVGALIGGTLADRWMRPTLRGRIFTSAIGMTLFCRRCSAWATPARWAWRSSGLIVFGLGWGFFDCNNMPILCQIARPEWRATGYGIMNLVSISCGGFGDWAFGALRDQHVPLNVIFGVFAGVALLSVLIVRQSNLAPISRPGMPRASNPHRQAPLAERDLNCRWIIDLPPQFPSGRRDLLLGECLYVFQSRQNHRGKQA